MAASGITAPSTASLAELPRPQLRTMKNGHGNSDGFLQVSPQTGIQQRNISVTNAFNFGPFHLLPAQRLLFKDDKVIHLGSRAMDILIALVERPNELVSKAELMARVWPNTFVEPANLTVHISALRRALGDGRDGNRFFINIPGRGYFFVAPVTQIQSGELDSLPTRHPEHCRDKHEQPRDRRRLQEDRRRRTSKQRNQQASSITSDLSARASKSRSSHFTVTQDSGPQHAHGATAADPVSRRWT